MKKIPSGSKVFVNSMSDLFHENVRFDFIDQVFYAIELRPDVVFQILTKRPERLIHYFKRDWKIYTWKHPLGNPIPKNIWFGVSVELELYAERIAQLRAMRNEPLYIQNNLFVSFEPLLGDIEGVDLSEISWIIIGGESGPHHRSMKTEWARNLVRQAKDQGVAVWMKQLGGFRPGGELEDFPEDLRIREFPKEIRNDQDLS